MSFKKIVFLFISVSMLMAFGPKRKKIVMIDVSHGGKDSGSIVDNVSEKDIVLNIANKVKELNIHKRLTIILTRESDTYISLKERVDLINSIQPSALLSIHANFSTESDVNGYELVVKQNSLTKESLLFASSIENNFPKQISKRKTSNANYFLLKNSKCPSAFLELGFLSNQNDREYLISDKGQWEIAEAILEAIR